MRVQGPGSRILGPEVVGGLSAAVAVVEPNRGLLI